MIFRTRSCAAALGLALAAAPALAQAPEVPGELKAEQDRLYAQLQESPADLDLMFRYATVSAAAQDFEQAIATLERMLIFNPNLPRVMLELGAAYFRIGSYASAEYWFREALASDPPEPVQIRVQQFLDEIASRTRTEVFEASISVGPVWSSNHNLGPDDTLVQVFDLNARLATDALSESSFGARFTAAARYVVDLEGPNTNAWISEGVYAALRYVEDDAGDLDAVILRTGPRLALDDETFGPKLRPFVGLGYVRSNSHFLYSSYGMGATLTNTLDKESSISGTVSADYRDYERRRPSNDGLYANASASATRRWGDEASATFTLLGGRDETRADFTSAWTVGASVSGNYNIDVGPNDILVDPLLLAGSARLSRSFYDDPDPTVNSRLAREDTLFRLSASLTAPFEDGWAMRLETSYFDRSSNIPNYEVSATEVGLFVVKNF